MNHHHHHHAHDHTHGDGHEHHHHSPAAGGQHEHSAHDVVQANKELFGEGGKGHQIMKTEDALKGAQQSAEAIKATIGSLDGLEILDFACGPGKPSLQFRSSSLKRY